MNISSNLSSIDWTNEMNRFFFYLIIDLDVECQFSCHFSFDHSMSKEVFLYYDIIIHNSRFFFISHLTVSRSPAVPIHRLSLYYTIKSIIERKKWPLTISNPIKRRFLPSVSNTIEQLNHLIHRQIRERERERELFSYQEVHVCLYICVCVIMIIFVNCFNASIVCVWKSSYIYWGDSPGAAVFPLWDQTSMYIFNFYCQSIGWW